MTPLLPNAKDAAREANSGSYIGKLHVTPPPRPPIPDAVFEDYQKLLTAAEVEPSPVNMPRLDPYAPTPVNSNNGKRTMEKRT